MSTSMFDPDSFLSEETKGANSTSIPPFPEGEFPAVVSKVEANSSGEYAILEVHWEIDDEECRQLRSNGKAQCRQSIFLDISETGGLDMTEGKNVQLGRLRKAVGQNGKGAWSPTMLEGATAIIKVTQKPDANDSSIVYNRVSGVTSVS